MDEFVLSIDKDKFRSTNAKWNELMLNDPWSVGYVSTLIEAADWKSKEEWEETYYASGKVRNALIEQKAENLGCSKEFLMTLLFHMISRSIINLAGISRISTHKGEEPKRIFKKRERSFMKLLRIMAMVLLLTSVLNVFVFV